MKLNIETFGQYVIFLVIWEEQHKCLFSIPKDMPLRVSERVVVKKNSMFIIYILKIHAAQYWLTQPGPSNGGV